MPETGERGRYNRGYKKISLTIRSWYINFHLMENIFMDVFFSPYTPYQLPSLIWCVGRCCPMFSLVTIYRSKARCWKFRKRAGSKIDSTLYFADHVKINTNVTFAIILLLIYSSSFVEMFKTAKTNCTHKHTNENQTTTMDTNKRRRKKRKKKKSISCLWNKRKNNNCKNTIFFLGKYAFRGEFVNYVNISLKYN